MSTRPRVSGTVAKVIPLDSEATIETSPLRQAAGTLHASGSTQTTMKKETKVIKKSISILTAILVVLGVSLICITCIKKEEDWYAKTYFDAVGIGYVFLYEVDTSGVTPVIRRDSGSFTPIKGANVTITTVLEGYHRWTSPVSETFTTDTNGRYQVRFIARTRRSNAISYQILMDGYFGFEGNPKIVSAAAVRNAQNNIVLIDTTRCNHWRR